MYTLPSKLKLFAIIFMVIGALGIVSGFLNTPSNTEEVKEMLASHNESHSHGVEKHDNTTIHHNKENSHETVQGHEEHGGEDEHLNHSLHQLQNRPWSAFYVASFFFFMIALGTLVFYAIQYAAQAGWSPVLLRVMEGISAYVPVGSIIIFAFLIASVLGFNHLFHWMDPELVNPESEHYDKIIAGKSAWLNTPFFLIRVAIYLLGWNLYRYFSRKNSIRGDHSDNLNWFKKNFKMSVGFLAFFAVTESMMAWDWFMGLDPHWYSTLYGWYIFAGMIVSAITIIAMVTILLKSQGYLEDVNNSHIHDLAKFMFGFSIFWTYLWFAQFMLIWYADMPEEATYFVNRIQDYNLLFFGMLVTNFVFPILVLMNSDFKRVNWFVILAGIVILIGHYVDVYLLVMPTTVGKHWFIGLPEIGAVLFFLGLFMFVVFTALTKAPLLQKNNPFIKESKHFHY
ncbi:MAG: quinol:cytochrome C oxidoreductase [Flavobacteriales bacterium]